MKKFFSLTICIVICIVIFSACKSEENNTMTNISETSSAFLSSESTVTSEVVTDTSIYTTEVHDVATGALTSATTRNEELKTTAKPKSNTVTPKTTAKPKATTKPRTTSKPVATKAPNTTSAPQGVYQVTGFESQMLSLVNNERAKAGLPALTLNSTLSSNSQLRAVECVSSFSHTRPNGKSCFTAVTIPYSTACENIAWGQTSASDVMNSWMNSSGHRANILNSSIKQAGFGCAKDASGVLYWVQLFIG